MNTKSKAAVGLSFSVLSLAANAVNYNVYGSWTDTSTIEISSGSIASILTSADLYLSGSVHTDSNYAGYNITGGNLALTGVLTTNYNDGSGPRTLYHRFDMHGSASNSGVVFNSGFACLEFVQGSCDAAYTDLTTAPAYFDGSGTFNIGYATTLGLQLLGGAGGPGFSVAQPGDLYASGVIDTNLWDGGTGTVQLAGAQVGMFLGGDIYFTEVPAPAAGGLFASALLALYGVNRKRLANQVA